MKEKSDFKIALVGITPLIIYTLTMFAVVHINRFVGIIFVVLFLISSIQFLLTANNSQKSWFGRYMLFIENKLYPPHKHVFEEAGEIIDGDIWADYYECKCGMGRYDYRDKDGEVFHSEEVMNTYYDPDKLAKDDISREIYGIILRQKRGSR